MAVIVIDAGHGGFDNGAMYQGRKEKDDNLDLALAVGKILEQQGYYVIYTRTTDIYQSVLRRTEMPAVLIETGFINNDRDNEIFDSNFNEVASAIAMGIERAVPLETNVTDQSTKERNEDNNLVFGIEVGRFEYRTTANFMAEQLADQGFDSYVFEEDQILHVVAGKESSLENVLKLQKELRNLGYVTMVVSAMM